MPNGWTYQYITEIAGKFGLCSVPVLGQAVVQYLNSDGVDDPTLDSDLDFVVLDEDSPVLLRVFKEYSVSRGCNLGIYAPGEKMSEEGFRTVVETILSRRNKAA
jgi:hypothetical protein